ncbi:hypothetical protein EJ08DRAFT_656933 [Tothia fuscella]|uniref:Uncharacterized protein n=1 Tax=Tothia fuscella TaxID=1048955 RepID=A0A9P4P0I2_9PEZI|nr:hypothetical protein EJ08DRAFT_656933 [Tothia fuscella]
MAYDQGQYHAPSRPYHNQQVPRGAPAPRGQPRGPPRGPPPHQYAQQGGGYQNGAYLDAGPQQGGYPQERQNYQQGGHESYQGYDADGFWDQYEGQGDYGYDQYAHQDNGQQYGNQGYSAPQQRQQQPQQYAPEQMRRRQDYAPRQRGYSNSNGMNGPPTEGGRGRGPPENYGPPQGGMQNYDNEQHQSSYPRGGGRTPPRQAQAKPRLMSPASPKTMGFDNPFPVFPTKTMAPKTDEQIAERAMANMDINGRPSQDSKRPPTSGSSNSYNSVRSANSRFQADSRGERPPRSSEDRYGPHPSYENRGPPLRAMTMPEERGYPVHDRRPQHDANSWQDPGYDAGGYEIGRRDPIPQRSNTGMGDRPGPMQAPPRPATASGSRPQANGHSNQHNNFSNNNFQPRMAQAPQMNMPPRTGTPQGLYSPEERPPLISKGSALEAYMPDFDAQPSTSQPLRDAIGIPLDAAPEAGPALYSVRSATPTRAPGPDAFYQQSHKTRSQPDLRGQANGYGRGDHATSPPVPNMPPVVGAAYSNGGQSRSPPHPLATNISPTYLNQGNGSTPNSPRHFHRPGAPPIVRNETNQSQWSDPGPAGSQVARSMTGSTMSSRSGLPVAAHLPARSTNPDALPINPLPVDALPAQPPPIRAGLMQQSSSAPPTRHREVSGAAQIRQVQAQRMSMSDSPRPSVDQKQGVAPVTHDELFRLREAVKINPGDPAQQLFLAKRLVEAAAVLANEEGRADARSTQKNREKFIFEAHKNVKKLVSVNYSDAMFYLADCYGTGQLGLAVDAKEAFKLYQAAAKLGHPPSAYRTAVCCEMGHELGGGTGKDPLKAVQWYRRAAALGDVPAMYKLGMILLKGLLGQQQSTGESMIWLQRAADRADEENPHALHELANLYENAPNGGKVIRDEGYAFQLYHKAARLGYRQSQTRLGMAFEYGQLGCAIDNKNSIFWYSKAASQEDHEAELALSGWYLTGSPDILKQSDSEAYLWARKAAMAEMPKAEFAMGYFSETGIGCPKSLEDAKRWYGRAATHKYPKAQERLEELKRGGTKGLKNRERHSRGNQNKNEDCVVM